MKKYVVLLFSLGIVILSGCTLTETKTSDNWNLTTLTNQIVLMQQQMSWLTNKITQLNIDNTTLKEENKNFQEILTSSNSWSDTLLTKIKSLEKQVVKYKQAFLLEKKKNDNTSSANDTSTSDSVDSNTPISNKRLGVCGKTKDEWIADPKYGDIGSLAMLFSADDCWASSLQRIWDVRNPPMDIWINQQLSRPISMRHIGFNCLEGSTNINCRSEGGQKRLVLEKSITTDEMLKLKPYYKYFEKVENYDKQFANDYISVNLLNGRDVQKAARGAISIIKNNYILYINPNASQASGVPGGRFAEITQGAPGADLVMKFYPADPCGEEEQETSDINTMTIRDLYINNSTIDTDTCNTLDSDKTVWYFSYASNNGYFGDYDKITQRRAGSKKQFVITMTYNADTINNLPEKGSAELVQNLNEMKTMIDSIVFNEL